MATSQYSIFMRNVFERLFFENGVEKSNTYSLLYETDFFSFQ